jgi:two-component system response regulator LytT
MKVVIIEDEELTAEDLAESIQRAGPHVQIDAMLKSVKEGIAYFKQHAPPDLIFSDIQLGDGLSFEIFKSFSRIIPVIFCTAYDEYALDAFTANGIHYIIKPYTQKNISEALHKYSELKKDAAVQNPYDKIFKLFEHRKNGGVASILIHYKDKILPMRIAEIALFYIENEITYLITFDQKKYTVNYALGEIEKMAGPGFYRASRQYLVNRRAIKDVSHHFSRKLTINLILPFHETLTVGKLKVSEFLEWLSGN